VPYDFSWGEFSLSYIPTLIAASFYKPLVGDLVFTTTPHLASINMSRISRKALYCYRDPIPCRCGKRLLLHFSAVEAISSQKSDTTAEYSNQTEEYGWHLIFF
jgi:hypothetical protein